MDKNKPLIIGLSGTNGSGKDSVGHILAEEHGFLFISVTDLLRQELKRRGLPPERQNMRALSAEWRHQYGLGVLIDRAKTMFVQADGNYKGLAISSLRNPHEADRVHELGGKVWWIDADPRLRFERLQAAKRSGRQGDDQKSFEQFLAEEQAEMTNMSDDEAALNMSAVKERSDDFIENHTSNIEPLKSVVQQTLSQYQ